MMILVQNSGMRRVLRFRDGDSERGSGIQEEVRTRLGGAQMGRVTAGAQPDRGVRASIEKGNRA